MLVWRVIAAALAVFLFGVVLIDATGGRDEAGGVSPIAAKAPPRVVAPEPPLSDDLRAKLRQRSLETRAW